MESFETKFGIARLVWMAGPGEQPAPAPAPAEEDDGSEGADDAPPVDTSAAEQEARAAAAAELRAREARVKATDEAIAERGLEEGLGAQAAGEKPGSKATTEGDEAPADGQQYTDADVESYLKENPDLKAAYGEYLSGQLTAPDFIKKAANKAQRDVLTQLTRPIDPAERRALLETKLKGTTLFSPSEIRADVESGKLTFREGYILMDSTTDKDIEALVSQNRMTRAEADIFQKALSTRESALSEMSKAAEEGGFVAVLTKMFEKLQRLFEQIGGYLEKMFDKMNPKFKNSPIGGQKFSIKANVNGGHDLTPAAPGPVNWMGDKPGKVEEAEGDKVIVKYGESSIIYTGVKYPPKCGKGDVLNPGAEIGEMSESYLTVQMVDKGGKQENLESLLRDFTAKEVKPKEEEKPAEPVPPSATGKEPVAPPSAEGGAEKAPVLQELKTKQYQAINQALTPYQGKKTDLTQKAFELTVPFVEGTALGTPLLCSLNKDNELKIGDLKYKMELPWTVSLESIEINGQIETGSATITAGNLLFSKDKKVSIAKMVEFINDLQAGKPAKRELPIEDGKVTFTKV